MARAPVAIPSHNGSEPAPPAIVETPPSPVEDGATLPQLAEAPAAPTPAPIDEPPAEPRVRVDDARARIAERIKAERAAALTRAVPLDHIPHLQAARVAPTAAITDPNDPDFIPGEVDPGAADAPPSAAAPTARAEPSAARFQYKPPVQGAAPPLNLLKVNGSTFQVSDDQLLQYADLSPEEADGLPREKIVALAQKNVAADIRLRDAKQPSRTDDRADRRPAATPAADLQPEPRQPAAPRTPPVDMKGLVRKVQLGDEDEAADAIAAFGEQLVDAAVSRFQTVRRGESIAESSQRGLREVQSVYPQIFEDDILAGAHTTAVARAIADEINAIQPLNSAQYAAFCNNPKLAAEAHKAALADGYDVAQPGEIMTRAADSIAGRFGLQPQRPSAPPQPSTVLPRRADVKRAAFTNTARTPSPQPFTDLAAPAPASDREATRLRRMQEIRAARHQA